MGGAQATTDSVRRSVLGEVVLFDRGEQHAKGSDTGMTALMVQVQDLAAIIATGAPRRRSRTRAVGVMRRSILMPAEGRATRLGSLDEPSSLFGASDADEPVGGFDELSDIGWCDPLSADRHQVFVGRLTGDRASLSNVDGQVVLPRLGEQVADGWHTDALQAVAYDGLEQFGGVPGKYDTDVVTDFQRPVDGEVKWNRGACRVGAAGRGHVQRPHE